MLFPRERTPEVQALVDADVHGKGFFIRVLAYILDLIVLVIIYSLAAAVFSVIVFLPVATLLDAAGRDYVIGDQVPLLLSLLLALGLSILYTAGMEAAAGATVGKLILGLRVVDYEGRLPSVGQTSLRAVLRLADAIVFGAVAYLQMKPPLQQRLGDKIARTLVVATRSPFVTQRRPWWVFLVALLGYCVLSGLSTVLLTLTSLRLN